MAESSVHAERAADEWWATLGVERRIQVHRWVAQGAATPPPPDDAQLTIEDGGVVL